MQNDFPEKKPLPENDPAILSNDEIQPLEFVEENAEKDGDDLVHNNFADEIPVNEEIDADDIVHRSATLETFPEDSEKDPDDLVHGN